MVWRPCDPPAAVQDNCFWPLCLHDYDYEFNLSVISDNVFSLPMDTMVSYMFFKMPWICVEAGA